MLVQKSSFFILISPSLKSAFRKLNLTSSKLVVPPAIKLRYGAFNQTEVEFKLADVQKICQRFLYSNSTMLEAERQFRRCLKMMFLLHFTDYEAGIGDSDNTKIRSSAAGILGNVRVNDDDIEEDLKCYYVLRDALHREIFLMVFDVSTMIFGGAVTHPHPGEDSSPSIAAIVSVKDSSVKCWITFARHDVDVTYATNNVHATNATTIADSRSTTYTFVTNSRE
ncbi:hypothetical protein F8388_011097 [Cannabis sativa]|uniref:Uncharacterized protein n=1 Tax=Cannabis sativa TaxID=3483 RepID=A0A7J6H1T9_CANSA|nr:hypothetical protein F8388_011097 [Cannabis sativa]KAF4388610.1 hypothetical protein G4B88_021521 [Cannabis sativa]